MENMQKYVGAFVRVGNEFGMIDQVNKWGLGFVTQTPNLRHARIVQPNEVAPLTKQEEIMNARGAAVLYFTSEASEMQARLDANHPVDRGNEANIKKWRDYCMRWAEKLLGA